MEVREWKRFMTNFKLVHGAGLINMFLQAVLLIRKNMILASKNLVNKALIV